MYCFYGGIGARITCWHLLLKAALTNVSSNGKPLPFVNVALKKCARLHCGALEGRDSVVPRLRACSLPGRMLKTKNSKTECKWNPAPRPLDSSGRERERERDRDRDRHRDRDRETERDQRQIEKQLNKKTTHKNKLKMG